MKTRPVLRQSQERVVEESLGESLGCRFYSTIQNLTKKERPKSI